METLKSILFHYEMITKFLWKNKGINYQTYVLANPNRRLFCTASVSVRPSTCIYELFLFLTSPPEPSLTKLSTNYPKGNRIQIC